MLASDSKDGLRASVPQSVSWASGNGLGMWEGVRSSTADGTEPTDAELLVVLSKMDT